MMLVNCVKIPVNIIGSLCLECYLIQKFIITDSLNNLFPLNIPIIMFIIIAASFLLKIISEWMKQTMNNDKGYDWKKVLCFFR